MRWSHLARHGLLSTSLVGAAATPAIGEPCKRGPDTIVGFTIGVDLAPKFTLVAGLEVRTCFSDNADGVVRAEFGGAGGRLIAGARLRPFEKTNEEDWGDGVGVEGGVAMEILGTPGAFGGHLALTFGSKAGYAALQGLIPISFGDSDRRNRASVLFGITPFQTSSGTPGRPITDRAGTILPDVLAFANMRCAEDRAVRDHFTRAAQLEYSSVWTFLRLAAELAAIDAPPALVARALDAADDEVRHAERCARAAGGLALAPLSMLAAQPRFTRRSNAALALLAREAWSEGCLNEGAAAEEARLAATEAQDLTRVMLETIARDEATHAQLAWDVLAWVRTIAPAVARAACRDLPELIGASSVEDSALARRGVASTDVRAEAWARASSEAIRRRDELDRA